MAACTVSFVDLDGIRHSVEVEAEGLYEASVLGLCAFRKHEIEPGGLTQLEVEVRSSVKHTLTVIKVSRVVAAWREDSKRSDPERQVENAARILNASIEFWFSLARLWLFAHYFLWILILAQSLKRWVSDRTI